MVRHSKNRWAALGAILALPYVVLELMRQSITADDNVQVPLAWPYIASAGAVTNDNTKLISAS